MKLEMEVKLKISRSRILDAVRKLRLKLEKMREVYQKDIFLDFSDLRMYRQGCGLRVRVEPGRVILCYKGPKETIAGRKTRMEIEWELGGREAEFHRILEEIGARYRNPPDSLKDLLEMLRDIGLKETVCVEKVREEYLLPSLGCKLCIDRVRGLGEFAELEGHRSLEVVKLLKLEPYVVEKTYAEMIASKNLKCSRESIY